MADQDVQFERLMKSRFYKRMIATRDLAGVDVLSLEAVVKLICENVAAVTTQVSTHFHAYTLHDMTHLWNVIGIMEELVPPTVWRRKWKKASDPLGPFQCALGLMAALVHDLGMAPPQQLTDKLEAAEDLDQPIPNDADRDFVSYRRHYASQEDDVRAIKYLRSKVNSTEAEKNADEKEILRRKQMIRTDYLRITHSDDTISGTSRIRGWLERFQPARNYTYGNWPYLDLLVNVAMSHAHSGGLAWLESQLGPSLIEDMGDEKATGLHVAWLLRLADILDLDASRAPAVLYRNFPPNNAISHQHWMQHLCISKRVINWDTSPPTVTFRKGDLCRNPEIYKSLTDYCGWIRDEVLKVEESQTQHSSVKDQFPIRLPGSQLDDRGRPRCIQLDPNFKIEGGWSSEPVRFELSKADVVKILMGEELYGEPELCLREVIQNALDATHLRWLRYELRQRMVAKLGEESYAKYDLSPADDSLNKDDLEIKVSWGVGKLPDDGWRATSVETDDDAGDERHWIEIEDPGTGMTVDVVKKYFTQIGRSYYQSPEYRRDKALFQEHELPASEISQFGIGILSCFMLADMVEIWTCPVKPLKPTDNDKPQHYRIWSDEGLFWHQPTDEKTSPGTRIKMWLKAGYTAACDTQGLKDRLASTHYGGVKVNRRAGEPIDPLKSVWDTVVWPRYKITFFDSTSTKLADWSLSPTSHLEQLLTLTDWEITSSYKRLSGEEIQESTAFSWAHFDWEHSTTASRIRVAIPIASQHTKQFHELADLVRCWLDYPDVGPCDALLLPLASTSLTWKDRRNTVIVRGIRIPDVSRVIDHMGIAAHAGCIVMVDLSGHAAPRLRADRKSTTLRQRGDWSNEVLRVFEEWVRDVTPSMRGQTLLCRLAEATVRLDRSRWASITESFSIDSVLPSERQSLPTARWLRAATEDNHLKQGLRFSLDPDFTEACSNHTSWGSLTTNVRTGRDEILDCSIGFAPVPDKVRLRAEDTIIDREHDVALTQEINRHAHDCRIAATLQRLVEAVHLPELFSNSLIEAAPYLHGPIAKGRGSDARMISPFQLEFKFDESGSDSLPATVPWESGWKDTPKWLESNGYDLVAPWTHVPVGRLRQTFPTWQTVRACRALAIVPFVFSSSLNWDEYHRVFREADTTLLLTEVPDLLMLLPEDSIQMLPFAEWMKNKTEDKVVTAYWKLDEDRVLWAEGFHDRASIRKKGRTIEEILDTEGR